MKHATYRLNLLQTSKPKPTSYPPSKEAIFPMAPFLLPSLIILGFDNIEIQTEEKSKTCHRFMLNLLRISKLKLTSYPSSKIASTFSNGSISLTFIENIGLWQHWNSNRGKKVIHATDSRSTFCRRQNRNSHLIHLAKKHLLFFKHFIALTFFENIGLGQHWNSNGKKVKYATDSCSTFCRRQNRNLHLIHLSK